MVCKTLAGSSKTLVIGLAFNGRLMNIRYIEMRNDEIERLRGLAVLFVFLGHIPVIVPFPNSGYWMGSGKGGVQLFFVISGFVVTQSLLRQWQNPDSQRARHLIGAFWLRRVFRILPLALFWLVVYALGVCFFNSTGAWGKPLAVFSEIFSILTLQYNYVLPYLDHSHLGQYWSLMVEEHFYLLLPLFMLLIPSERRQFQWLGALTLFTMLVLRPFLMPDSEVLEKNWYLYATTHRNLDFLALGSLLAYLPAWRWSLSERLGLTPARCRALGVAALVILWLSIWLLPSSYYNQHGNVAMLGAAGFLVFLAQDSKTWLLNSPGIGQALYYLGTRSYGIYLAQTPLIRAFKEIEGRWGWHLDAHWALLVFCICTGVVVEVLFRYLEEPLRRVGKARSEQILVSAEFMPRDRQAS